MHSIPHFDATVHKSPPPLTWIDIMDTLTDNLIPHTMLANEIPQQLLIHTGLVYDSSVPERTSEFESLEENRLGLLEAQVVAEAVAQAHGAEA
jgi:hypothetical protein